MPTAQLLAAIAGVGWLNQMRWRRALPTPIAQFHIRDRRTATLICRLIPGRCPFERSLQWRNYRWQIPALCQLNPFYEQCLQLRCKALLYLAQTAVPPSMPE